MENSKDIEEQKFEIIKKKVDEEIGKEIYTVYCKGVGGKSFNGDVLPDKETFFNDTRYELQIEGWRKVGEYVHDLARRIINDITTGRYIPTKRTE